MFLYRSMFSSFPSSIENHAHYRVSTSVCHLWGPEKRVSCHPLTGLIWARMWGGGGGFLNPKNLKFERFHILKNSWKWRIEFLNFPLLKSVSTRKTFLFTYVLFLLVFTFVNLFPFLMFLFGTMFSSFPNSIENHAHCTFTPSVCKDQKNVYHVIHWPGSFGPGCGGGGGGFLNPKNLKFERFHVLKNNWKWLIEFLNFPLLKSVCTRKTYLYIHLVFACLYICKPFSIRDVLI